MTDFLSDREKKKLREETKLMDRQRRWKAKNVSVRLQKLISAQSVEELKEYIGTATGSKKKFAEMEFNRRRQK